MGLQYRAVRDELRSKYSAQAHSEVHVTQNLNGLLHNRSFDIDSSHMLVGFDDSNFGTGGQHINSHYIMDAEENLIYRTQIEGTNNLG